MPDFATPTGESVMLQSPIEVLLYDDAEITQMGRDFINAAAAKYGFTVMSEPRTYVVRIGGSSAPDDANSRHSGVSVVPF